MERRKFIIGAGSLAAGGAAAMGSGAFESVEADRGVTVSLAADANAYLALTADNEYVTNDSGSGTLSIDLGDATTSGGGQGFNDNARTVVNAVNVENQGQAGNGEAKEVTLSVDGSDLQNGVAVEVNGSPELLPGESVSDVLQFTVNTRNYNPENSSGQVTIQADEVYNS